MEKSWRVRCSNWEAEEFSPKQIEYAAHDAIVAVHIFLTLAKTKRIERTSVDFVENINHVSCTAYEKEKQQPKCNVDKNVLDTSLPSTHEANDVLKNNVEEVTMILNKYETDSTKGHITNVKELLSDQLFCQQAISLCKGITDLDFKDKFMKKPSVKSEGFMKTDGTKKPFKRGTTMRKSPLYTKCQLIAPDGQMLCTFDRKKAQWYLDKEIGKNDNDNDGSGEDKGDDDDGNDYDDDSGIGNKNSV